MSIRRATHTETQTIWNYSFNVFNEATMGYGKLTSDKVLQMAASFLHNGGYYLVHNENNIIQGWIGVARIVDYYKNDMAGFIFEIYVLPYFRKQGVAEKLCEAAFRQLSAEGLNKVQLNVFAGNRAKHLYQKLGFQEISSLMEKKISY
ncbi:Ribosomal protein S18 acetylase RimI [Terribacillus aidingensis]|uniref:Ribosomal protein S18 acetylase RimI n=1 Tax=Terribacillus aidingensis TaxID=586416 RepID=A0A285NNK9_9BACI|nr:GNAT family N-acetyltransferase [Terribacillus aidingensis]SNZ09446.1 Ribosomal protein S18 acetylase RimI [Terribacillus aidingensis]